MYNKIISIEQSQREKGSYRYNIIITMLRIITCIIGIITGEVKLIFAIFEVSLIMAGALTVPAITCKIVSLKVVILLILDRMYEVGAEKFIAISLCLSIFFFLAYMFLFNSVPLTMMNKEMLVAYFKGLLLDFIGAIWLSVLILSILITIFMFLQSSYFGIHVKPVVERMIELLIEPFKVTG